MNGRIYDCRRIKLVKFSGSHLIAKYMADLTANGEHKLTERHKMIRTFLCGTLCGVMMAAALTFTLAIPANNDHWRVEITKRGGGDWYFDKNGHLGWMWTVEPISNDRPVKKAIVVPATKEDVAPKRL
jgi:hypothetical protein